MFKLQPQPVSENGYGLDEPGLCLRFWKFKFWALSKYQAIEIGELG